MRRFTKLESLPGNSEWDIARALVDLHLWPYYVDHDPGSAFDAHYHRTDEQLQLLRGSMRFIYVGNDPIESVELNAGDRMQIPEGTVHSVAIGPAGAAYVMGLACPMSLDAFAVSLPTSRDLDLPAVARLVEANYQIAEAEETGERAHTFFSDLLSDRFVFIGAVGSEAIRKDAFLQGLDQRKDRGRRGTGLRLRREGTAVVAIMVVTTADGGEYLNTRLFEREGDGLWRCVRWANAEATPPARVGP